MNGNIVVKPRTLRAALTALMLDDLTMHMMRYMLTSTFNGLKYHGTGN
jgi:hypothetical protein